MLHASGRETRYFSTNYLLLTFVAVADMAIKVAQASLWCVNTSTTKIGNFSLPRLMLGCKNEALELMHVTLRERAPATR